MSVPRDTPDGPRVSVVIPVYNPGAYLRECLDSLLAQDLPPGALEVVAVDDGSTDGSGEVLDAYAARHPAVRVVHQENSGWPGRPRNRGVGEARGTYVFFMDADDRVGPEAMRRLADFADEHGSDVVVPKMVPLGGRYVQAATYARTQVDADLERVFKTLSPQKLFRREFLEREDLRFPEGKVRLEDGMLLARAYLRARRVSVLVDYDYYFIRTRQDGANISATLGDPAAYIHSVATVIDIVREHAADPALADAVALDLYRRKGLKHFRPDRLFNHKPRRLRAWLEASGELARTRIPVELEQRLPFDVRLRSRFVRHGDLRALRAVVGAQRDGTDPPAALRDGRVVLRVPHDGPPETLDVTADVALRAGVRSLRARGRTVRVRGEVRLAGVRVRDLPVSLVAGTGRSAVTREVPTSRGPGAWHAFAARIDVPAGGRGGRGVPLRLRLDEPRGEHLTAVLTELPPPPAPLRERLSPASALRAAERWTRRPALRPVRRRAVTVVQRWSPARRLYRRARGVLGR